MCVFRGLVHHILRERKFRDGFGPFIGLDLSVVDIYTNSDVQADCERVVALFCSEPISFSRFKEKELNTNLFFDLLLLIE